MLQTIRSVQLNEIVQFKQRGNAIGALSEELRRVQVLLQGGWVTQMDLLGGEVTVESGVSQDANPTEWS